MAIEQLPPPTHPILAWASAVAAGIDDALATDPMWLRAQDRADLLDELTGLSNRLEALRLRVIAGSTDVAQDHGARNVAGWLTPRTLTDYGPNHRDEQLATALARRWTCLGAALADGRVNPAQARVIVEALDRLAADDLVARAERHLIHRAEKHLIELAADHPPRHLRRLGEKILEVLAPDHYDDLQREQLQRAERRAAAATRLTLRHRRDGSVDLHARIPEALAARLKTYLAAFTSPRHHKSAGENRPHPAGPAIDPATGVRLGRDRVLGEAFCTLLESLDATRLPIHGGNATTVVVTIDLDTLLHDTGIATLADGTPITAGQARRLACSAGIIPAVLGGTSEVLDLGRSSRFYDSRQRLALMLQHPQCQTDGCTMPAQCCEAHHKTPWSHGGRTDLDHAILLCPWHHHRIHDPAYHTTHLPNGDVRFHRRR